MALAVLVGCFTYQTPKYVTDTQALFRDVCALTEGKVNGLPFSQSPYGLIAADEAIVLQDYKTGAPLSLNQLTTLESSLALYETHDSIGASPEFFRVNQSALDTTAWQLVLGEQSKNIK